MQYKISTKNDGCAVGKSMQETNTELQNWIALAKSEAGRWPQLIEKEGYDFLYQTFLIEAWRVLCSFQPKKAGDSPGPLMRLYMRNRAKNILAGYSQERRGGGEIRVLSIEGLKDSTHASADHLDGVDYNDPASALMMKEEENGKGEAFENAMSLYKRQYAAA